MLKALLRRVRQFMQAGVMAELAAIRAELVAIRMELARRDALAQQFEAALLTLALHAQERGESPKESSAF